jgi:DMSO/TMAO reductase YedYZ molybdopterin-dependent catalytic subunit/xanthosine utilization system XapX-like protein
MIDGIPSPVAAVGAAVIDVAPPGAKQVVVGLFGTADKPAILLLVTLVVLLAGAGIGLLRRRSVEDANIAMAALIAVGAVASLRITSSSLPAVVLAAAAQILVGFQVIRLLWAMAPRTSAAAAPAASAARRQFLVGSGALGVAAVVGGGLGRWLVDGRAKRTAAAGPGTGAGTGTPGASRAPGSTTLPSQIETASPPPPDASFAIDGITPIVMPNDNFYRIDTALVTPSVDLASWQLRVFGMVEREVRLNFDELLQLPLVERYVTIACVSNEVGGTLVGNAKWTGVRLLDVLEMAGVKPGATQIVPRSVDGWTAGFPTAWLHDTAHPREAIIAVRMNDAPLPVEHGYPARLIVPGLYGYVSATKWLSELELTTLEAFDAYWVPRGWAKEAPILTQSRIDVPRDGANLPAGTQPIAGVAWAPDRGIRAVEVSVDGGPWQAAVLATEISAATWIQWKFAWSATPGQHVIEVRATDGTGDVQTADRTAPDPDGARGHHRIAVTVA